MRSLRHVMSECPLSGRGHGHVSNFYIVNLENFATASRRYTGDNGAAGGNTDGCPGRQKPLRRHCIQTTILHGARLNCIAGMNADSAAQRMNSSRSGTVTARSGNTLKGKVCHTPRVECRPGDRFLSLGRESVGG